MIFNIRVKGNSAFGYIGLIDINYTTPCKASYSTTNIELCSSQLPFEWNGINYTTSGTYTKYFNNSIGCDSIATLVLNVKQPTSSINTVAICESQLPYNWNGADYNQSGIYVSHFLNTAGCDSTATLALTVNANSASTTIITICDNQTPYNWNDQYYSNSGIFTKTLTNAAGCDSIATLALTVNNSSASTTTIIICDNQTPYNWNDQSYSNSGIYTKTLTNAAGCDSIATLALAINNSSTSTTTITICNNQTPYNWNDQSYSNSGIYTKTLTNAAGCDSIATLALTVNNSSTSTTTISICNNQTPYNWNGQSYSNSGIYTKTLTNATGCDSIATLALTVNNSSTSTTTTTICANQTPFNWNGQSYYNSGTYTKMLINAKGCDSTLTLNLTVTALPQLNIGVDTTVSILSAPFQLTGNPSGGTFSGIGVSNNVFSPSVSGLGTFTITYFYTNPITGCSNSISKRIIVTCSFSVGSAIIGNTNACMNMGTGDSAVYSIAATDAVTYSWSVSNTTTMGISPIRNGNSVKIKYATTFTTGTITLIITGCNGNSITRTLSISKVIPNAPTTTGASSCGTGNVTLSSSIVTGQTTNWYSAATGGTLLLTGSSTYTTPLITATSTYYAQAITPGCVSATRTATIATINAIPSAVTTTTTAAKCSPDTLTISATAANGFTIDWYADSTSTTVIQSGIITGINKFATPFINSTKNYWAVQRNLTTGCRSAIRKKVTATINVKPSAPTVTNGSICGSGKVTLSAVAPTNPAGTVAWYNVTSGGTSLSTATSYNTPNLSTTTTYYVEAKITATGCISASRSSVVASINSIPTAPVAVGGTGCGTSSVSISATTAVSGTIDWYSAASNGTLLRSGSLTYTTPVISATTTYYATARNSLTGCISSSRTPVTATIKAILAAPTTLSGLTSICSIVGKNIGTTYTATAVTGATSYVWTIPTGAVIDSGSNGLKIKVRFNTAGTNDSIFVRASNGCLGNKKGLKLITTGCATTAKGLYTESDFSEPLIANLFPIPTMNSFFLKIKSTSSEIVKIKISDLLGRSIQSIQSDPYSTIEFGKALKPGTYIVEITQGAGQKILRAVKL